MTGTGFQLTKVGQRYQLLEGLAVPYLEVADLGKDTPELIMPNAFAGSTVDAGRPLPLLVDHDNQQPPIGHSVRWSSSSVGLYGAWQLNDSNQAREAVRLIARGRLNGLSAGYQITRSQFLDGAWDPRFGPGPTRLVLEARLLDVSLTRRPAYEGAGVSACRSAIGRLSPRTLDEWKVEALLLRQGM